MTLAELDNTDLAGLAQDLRARGEPFAIATVIRTLGATAAKPGAKALLGADGDIRQGWIGGGCVRAALRRATERAIRDRKPQLISLQPQDLLAEKGIDAGADLDGIRYARNGCPSKGSMDIFVEPILPQPELVVIGASPVAHALARLAPQFQWAVTATDTAPDLIPTPKGARRMVVVATQGAGDLDGLQCALSSGAEFVAFVGSRRKFAALADKLIAAGVDQTEIDKVEAPAGLAIDAVTPEEIALSILAQLIQQRRRHQRGQGGDHD
ncbi:XdhC family protein [Thalassovita mangrovi]|uniref:XdhC /CoxI family-like protein n=1 Tax=Thalassovita mangrovi TaxID=2692236 RepID=A0A6L8LJH5_9RHOB|nr:XdhC family protein [Thalassovita mangrovi]MYM55995.1 XdhC /CoxI family-like protein [Thalassovita mangrovi]